MDDYEKFFIGKPPAGTVFNLGGVLALYWPYVHPCREPYDQWVLFFQEGSTETVTELPGWCELPAEPLGVMPGMVGYIGSEA